MSCENPDSMLRKGATSSFICWDSREVYHWRVAQHSAARLSPLRDQVLSPILSHPSAWKSPPRSLWKIRLAVLLPADFKHPGGSGQQLASRSITTVQPWLHHEPLILQEGGLAELPSGTAESPLAA